MRRFAFVSFVGLLSSSAAMVACGARTTALSEADFSPTPASDGGLDSSIDSSTIDTGFTDTRPPPFDSRPTDTFVPFDTTPPPPIDGGGDHTVGDRCKSDDDCDKTGDGVNRCTAGIFSVGSLYPTNVCIGIECDPGDGTSLARCDGDRGICLATDGGGGSGICLPLCSFGTSGAAPTGCAGKDACNEYTFDHDAAGALVGYGYCFAGCLADSDCETPGEKCQKETGQCMRRVTTYTKKLGEACTSSDATKTPPACNCIYTTTNKGYCSEFCEMGVTACAAGYTCDPFLPKLDPFTGGPGFPGKVLGLAGYCLKNCATDAECAPLNGYCEENGGTGTKTCQPGTRP